MKKTNHSVDTYSKFLAELLLEAIEDCDIEDVEIFNDGHMVSLTLSELAKEIINEKGVEWKGHT